MPPLVFMAVRFMVAGALLLAVAYGVRAQPGHPPPRPGCCCMAAGMVGTGFYQPLFLYGLALTTASNTSLLIATSPAFVALLNRLLGREILSGRGWVGIALTFAGVVLIIEGGHGFTLTAQSLLGDC
jgi:drug/metabolite transporter (DMT)-like permease